MPRFTSTKLRDDPGSRGPRGRGHLSLQGVVEARQQQLIDQAASSRKFFLTGFCVSFILGGIAFGVALAFWIRDTGDAKKAIIAFTCLGCWSIAWCGWLIAALQVPYGLKKRIRLLECESEGYLVKSVLSQEQWSKFAQFDFSKRIENVVVTAITVGIIVFSGSALAVWIRGLLGYIYKYLALGSAGLSLFLILVGVIVSVVISRRFLLCDNRSVFVLDDALIYSGEYISWTRDKPTRLERTVPYLVSIALEESEKCGWMLKLRIVVEDHTGQRAHRNKYGSISESDVEATRTSIEREVRLMGTKQSPEKFHLLERFQEEFLQNSSTTFETRSSSQGLRGEATFGFYLRKSKNSLKKL